MHDDRFYLGAVTPDGWLTQDWSYLTKLDRADGLFGAEHENSEVNYRFPAAETNTARPSMCN